MSTPRRLLDATPTECVLSAREPVDEGALAAITDTYPITGVHVAHTAPVLPDGAYGADLLAPLRKSAHVVEPVGARAHTACGAASPERPGTILVDPQGVPLGAPFPESPAIAAGWVRERVAWVPADTDDLSAVITQAIARLPPDDRLRLRDPSGRIGLTEAAAIAAHPDAYRLTVAPENAGGLALAVATILLARQEGATVRTSLLGIGPRSGLPLLELCVPHDDSRALQGPAERAALLAGIRIADEHPLWGARRHEAPEPERLLKPNATPRWNPATTPLLLREHLEEWGFETKADEVERLARALLARLRPGETPDGPILYAFVATHLDLANDPSRKQEPSS